MEDKSSLFDRTGTCGLEDVRVVFLVRENSHLSALDLDLLLSRHLVLD